MKNHRQIVLIINLLFAWTALGGNALADNSFEQSTLISQQPTRIRTFNPNQQPTPVMTPPVSATPATTPAVTPQASSPVVSPPVTNAPATSAQVVTSPTSLTTPAITTTPVIAAPTTDAPVTTAPVTTAPVTTAPITTDPFTPQTQPSTPTTTSTIPPAVQQNTTQIPAPPSLRATFPAPNAPTPPITSFPAGTQTTSTTEQTVQSGPQMTQPIIQPSASPLKVPMEERNVVLIIADDQGLDMGAYGNSVIRTPSLDGLAASGTLFKNGFATVSSCSPSRSVIYSGLYSHTNGMYGLAHDVHNQHLLPWVVTLPKLLKANRYVTCLVGKKHILPLEALQFDEELAPEKPGKRDVSFMADQVGNFLSMNAASKFFLVVAFSDPHRGENGFGDSNEAPAGTSTYKPDQVIVPPHLNDLPEVRQDLAEYYESVSRLDRGVGLVIDKLRAADKLKNTLIIYLSDNGRPFIGAKTTLYDDGIHLPLMVVSPEQLQHGLKSEAMVSWTDIAPTILEWTGTPGPTYKLPGRSVLGILDNVNPPGWDRVFASHCFHEIDQYYPMRAMRTHQYKYIYNDAHQLQFPISSDIQQSKSWLATMQANPKKLGDRSRKEFFQRPVEELYDVIEDPNETKNLATDNAAARTLNELRNLTKDFRKNTNDPWYHGQPALTGNAANSGPSVTTDPAAAGE